MRAFSDVGIMHGELPASRYSHSAAVTASFCCLGQRNHIDMSLKMGPRLLVTCKHTLRDNKNHLVQEITWYSCWRLLRWLPNGSLQDERTVN